MGVDMNVKALNLARKIALFNSQTIHYVKNSLFLMTPSIEKKLGDDYEKFVIMINDSFPNTDKTDVLANYTNNDNHDITKLDIETIKELLMDGVKKNDS